MYHKNIEYRRYQRDKHIHQRVEKLVGKNLEKLQMFTHPFNEPGRYAKWNLACTCRMCQVKSKTHGYKASEQRKIYAHSLKDENI